MKKSFIHISIIAATALMAVSCIENKTGAEVNTTEESVAATQGTIVYFNLDRVISEYDMANDLRSAVEAKVNSINEEVNRRRTKLEKEVKTFQEKINKGLLTQSVATAQGQKLAEQEQAFNEYTYKKQQEIAEEQQVMMNQIADAINTFVTEFNVDKQYAMILSTTGDILPTPVVVAKSEYDITDQLLEGLNAEYVKTKNAKQ